MGASCSIRPIQNSKIKIGLPSGRPIRKDSRKTTEGGRYSTSHVAPECSRSSTQWILPAARTSSTWAATARS